MFDPVNLQLFELICHLEVSLHQASTRRSAQLLQQLLHDEFLEIGRSGERYDKTQTVTKRFVRQSGRGAIFVQIIRNAGSSDFTRGRQ